ncbi:hypothetical protein AX16_003086 [Volvariella volvacea WC 439]|nr:hypothetical protein AX16_003086 [Volvariella volvacea WC 439]
MSSNVVVANSNLKIEGPISTFQTTALSGNVVTRTFCSKCGSHIAQKGPVLGDYTSVHTGNFPDFAEVPITFEIFTKDRWSGIKPVEGALQFEKMPPQ